MDLKKLSDKQLVLLHSNRGLKGLWDVLDSEINHRKLDALQISMIREQLDLKHKELIDNADVPLSLKIKIFAYLFPPMIRFLSFNPAKELGKGFKKKNDDYWRCVKISCLIYSLLLLCFSTVYYRVVL